MSNAAESSDRMRVLGIEGTAWAASAAIFETADPAAATDDEHVFIESDAYLPESGGIHPREAAEHMGEAIPQVVRTAIEHAEGRAREAGDDPASPADADDETSSSRSVSPIDAVAFSRGPGLGPCLRIVGTAARTVAQRFDVPLVGVNHMVAHLEVGRHYAGFDDPVCLNASGANAHILGYRNGRYRVLGETMDTGVGNALDKFTRHVGWSHPGGPKVEAHAKAGEYVDLPYVVKGMDFSFSGIMSAAKQAVDDGTAVEDVCRGLQENVFAMLTEVSERALSLTDGDELVLGGGVAQNDRLREMLAEMCDQRGADFFAPPARFLRDNAGMIAILGAKQFAADDCLSVEESGIDSNFRPDQVDVTWRTRSAEEPGEAATVETGNDATEIQGAEATVRFEDDRVVKERRPRSYRHPALDERLRTERTRQEARLTSEARRQGVPTPVIRDVDPQEARIVFQRVGDRDLRESLTGENVRDVGRHLARIHDAGFVHGDPTTRNARCSAPGDGRTGSERCDAPRRSNGASRESEAIHESRTGAKTFLIDFGLGYATRDEEDHAMDLHVFAQSLAGTADDAESLHRAAADAYHEASERDEVVLDQLREIEGRGRYQ